MRIKPVAADDVFDLMDSYVTSAALNTAMELGLFWLLAEQPLDTAGIAQALRIPQNRCQYWLQLLISVGLIEQVSQGYAPSSTARTAILDVYSQDTWAFVAREARYRTPAVCDLALHIHEPGSAWQAQGLTPPDYFARIVENPETARRFTRMLYEIHLALAAELTEALDMRGVDRLLDLGGGSGVMSLALLRRYPNLGALVVDIASVCAAGREIAAENAVQDRITYLAADFLQDELPSGFDMVLQCDAGPLSEAFFRKIRASLKPGGRLVIVQHFAPTKGVAPSAWLYWAFLAAMENPDFSLLTVAEVQSRLEQAGFELLSERTLPSRGVVRWSSDWVMIEARRQYA
jgi:ubiquinone/menaquinone biosynthesis C-methylase UbiE